MIKNMGYRVVILNRGYRSHWDKELGVVSDGKKIFMTAYEAGDEAYLMAKTLPGIPDGRRLSALAFVPRP